MQEFKATVEPLQFVPNIRSGSFADIGPRRYMEDEHIRIDDLSGHLGSLLMFPEPNAFYGVCMSYNRCLSYCKSSVIRIELTVLLLFRFLMAMGVQMQQLT